jgi:RNA polymerase sigma factor (sigma-70 family)
VSPLVEVRRRRAENVIARDVPGMEGRIRRAATSSLRRHGIQLTEHDFEDFMQEARLGLYGRLLDGEEVPNPAGFLVTVVTRRALDAKRRQTVRGEVATYEVDEQNVASESDFAAQLDNAATIRRFVEGAKAHLSEREAQAVALTQIFDYTRPKAAEILGVAPKRMEKIMDSAMRKVGAYCAEITAGEWCESRRSLLNAYAFGVLDPEGDRYQLALDHLADCPACRRYVLTARGLAALLPPVFLPIKALGAAGVLGAAIHGASSHTASTLAASSASGTATAASGATAGVAASGTSAVAGGTAGAAAGGGLAMKAVALVAAAAAIGAGAGNVPIRHHTHKDADKAAAVATPRAPQVIRTMSRREPTVSQTSHAAVKSKSKITKKDRSEKRAGRSAATARRATSQPTPRVAAAVKPTPSPKSTSSTGTTKSSGAEFGLEG